MNIRFLLISLLIFSLFATNVSLAAEQKMLFNVESISYKSGTGADECQSSCSTRYYDPPLKEMIAQGWRIISSSPKEAIGSRYYYFDYPGSKPHGCTCIGTQYVLQKDDPAPIAKPDAPSKNEELLTKENELLKREIELLKNENEKLKDKLKLKQKKK